MSDANAMRAIVADPAIAQKLELRTVDRPVPGPNQVLVRVHAISLNAGDTRTALAAESPYVPGWDFAGIIEIAAADGSSPPGGARVFGFTGAGAWAEYVCVPSGLIAQLPDSVSFAQAAALPVAGVTAMVALRKGGNLAGKRVLITGAAGGVGRYACQIATHAGAKLHAVSRREGFAARLAEDGINVATVYRDIAAAAAAGPFDFILDSVGGASLAGALGALDTDGICVNCGNSTNEKTCFNVRDFYIKDGVQLHGLYLGKALMTGECSAYLTDVARLVAEGILRAPIGDEAPWTDIAQAARRLTDQSVDGKIILHIV